KLKEHKIYNNTLFIFTSDNGPWLNFGNHAGSALPLREGKGTAWEGGQREPTVVSFPNLIKGEQTIETPMMAIDILPTIAEITGAELPKNTIDGKSILKILTGEDKQSPQEAYFFYYKSNELHGVKYKDWKLYFPHSYRTLNGREGGKDGYPVKYEMNTIEKIELYDLKNDISETNDVAAQHPEVVEKIKVLANEMRSKLGDKLYNIEGTENRPVGRIN
ncbi:MAG: sulfatase-like hydrolase/transferase, partial [Flavobacteriaceae bacterium]|nr:sulfatase-like hydrolase/transferase [Flavobacteriaceae bacterium]